MRPAKTGKPLLGQSDEPWFVFACDRCGRRGEYKRETLITQFGPDVYLTELHLLVAKWRGCTLVRPTHEHYDLTTAQPCGIYFDVDHDAD